MLARRLKTTEVADYFFSCKHHAIERRFYQLGGFYHFPPLAKALPEKRRRHADCKLDGSMQMRWRSECFLRSIFHLLPGADRLESRAPFLFLSFSLRFTHSRSHRRSILREQRERSYSRCGVLDAGYRDRDIREGWYINHDRRHYRWWVAPGDRRNWFRERPIASARDRLRTGIARLCVDGGRYFGGVLAILFNLPWAQM